MADLQELRGRVERREYDVDPERVATAILARLIELHTAPRPADGRSAADRG